MTTPIPDLPPFTPRLEGFRLDEFHQQSLELLFFPIEHDQRALDLDPFQIVPPPPPPEPPLPLLPYIWYPKPTRGVRDWALGTLIPPRSINFHGKTRHEDAQRAMRPLLAGSGPVMIQGEPGLGKTTLLAHIAGHEKTRQRYRRIWWMDDPPRVVQSLALALNVAQVLIEKDPLAQFHQLREALDNDTLLIIDNLLPADIERFRGLSPNLLMGVETSPEALAEGQEIQPDPEGIVTLRSLPRQDALELMVEACGVTDRNSLRGQMRAWMAHIGQLLGGHPLAIKVAGALFREDGLPMERLVEIFSQRIEADHPNPTLALEISLEALPADYQELLVAFGVLPLVGAGFEAITATARLDGELANYRGLSFLVQRGFIAQDNRIGTNYSAHRLIWERMQRDTPDAKKAWERLRNWVLSAARRCREDAAGIYRIQREILHTLENAHASRLSDFIHKTEMTIGPYLREYAPLYLTSDVPVPKLIGARAKAATLVGDGLRHLNKQELEPALEAFTQGLHETENHGSEHEIAEALVAFARYNDQQGDYAAAISHLERAAKLVFDLKAENSLHVIRLALAMVYRKQERYKEALAVLDDEADTHAERARIYRAIKQWEPMLKALEAAEDLSPYAKAEGYLAARRYADALSALATARDSESAFLRAIIYHLQDDLDNAIRGYEMALETVSKQTPQRIEILLAMGKAYVSRGELEKAERLFLQTLDIYPTLGKSDEFLRGKALGLLAALELLQNNAEKAIHLGKQASEAVEKTSDKLPTVHTEKANINRTLGRAYQRRGIIGTTHTPTNNRQQALAAFEAEVNHAQSITARDEARIGIALHHLADTYQANAQADRAIANYRRALTHKDAQTTPLSYFMTQVALFRVLFDEKRFGQALETCQAAIVHLNTHSPADLQHLGYMLCCQARTEQELGNLDLALKTLGQWLSTLAGRSDSLQDSRPQVILLALLLAVRSLLANQRADEALPFAEIAVNTAELHYPSSPTAWSARRDLGQLHLNLSHWQTSIECLSPLLYESVQKEPFTFALAHEYSAIAYAHLNTFDQALAHFAIALIHQPIDHQKALLLERMADIYLELGQAEAAIDHARQSIPLLDRVGFPGDAARILTKLARLLSGTNRYAESIEIYEDALAMLRSLPDADLVHTARVYMSLASSHEAQGQYPQAAIAYRNALNTLESARKASPEDHRKALIRLAAVQVAMQSYDEAIGVYLQAKAETELYSTPRELGLVVAALANAYRLSGRMDDALDASEEALTLQPADDMPRERAATLRGYGQALAIVGQLPEARDAWTEALKITTDSPALEVALTHRSIAQAYAAQRMFDGAEKAYRDALSYHQPGVAETAETWRLLGKTMLDAQKHGEAIRPLQQALDIEKGLPQQVNVRIVETLDMLAVAHEHTGNITGAIASHHEALVYTDRNLQPIQTANRFRLMGRLYTLMERWQDAHTALEEALTIEFNHKPRSDNRIAQTLEMIALAYRREGNLQKAAEAYKRMASYSNLNKSAAEDLKTTMDTIQRHEGTLEAARASLNVLQRTSDADIKDLIYVYALLAHSYSGLSQFEESNDAIDKLLTVLEKNAAKLSASDERAQYRALAHVFEASQAASEGNLVEARAHFQMALHDTTDPSMRWVIEQGLTSVQE